MPGTRSGARGPRGFARIVGAARRLAVPPLWRLYERRLDRVLTLALEGRTGTFVDVGAHLGEFLRKLKRSHPAMPYVGFEPNPASHAEVADVIRRRGYRDATVIAAALCDRTGTAELRSGGDPTDPEASIVEGFRDPAFYRTSVTVRAVPGDAALTELGVRSVALVKIDVEGAELEVLRGLERTLRRDRPPILCELLPTYEGDTPLSERRIERQNELAALLDGLGYRVGCIGRNGSVTVVERLVPHSDLDRRDHVFASPETLQRLVRPS